MSLSELEYFSKVRSLLTELVEVHAPCRRTNESVVESLLKYICEYTLKAKQNGSDFNAFSEDTFTILKNCEDKISKRCNDPKFSRFLHLFNQLGDLSFVNRLIRFLLMVSDENDPNSHPIKLIDSPNFMQPLSDLPALNLEILIDNLTPSTSESALDHSSDEESSSVTAPASDAEHDRSFRREESDLVSGLLEVLQGRDSSLFAIARDDGDPRLFVLRPSSPMPPLPLLSLCLRVGELGCCLSRIKLHLAQMDSSSSLFSSGLAAAVRAHIGEYTEYVSLFPQLQAGPHSLRTLLLFLLDPMYSMKRICSLLENCKEERGGTLVNIIYKSSITGCPKMRRILNFFLGEVLLSLQSLLYKWVCLGEVDTEYQHDFFIKNNPVHKGEIWEKGYEVDLDNLPEFITLRLADKVLVIGKTVAFMRNVCDEPRESFSPLERKFNNFTLSFDSVIDGSFECIIYELYLSQSGHLLQLLNNKFNLKQHLEGFRDYFLMSRGDIVFPFLDQAKLLLDGPARYLENRHLKSIYLDSLRITPARLKRDEILNRLDTKLITHPDGDVGWYVFNLDYILTPPLDTVFPPQAITSYQSIFRFVLMVRNCEHLILDIWKLLHRYNSPVREDLGLSELFYLSHFFTNSILHFVRKLEYFISYDIFTCEWDALCEALVGCRDLEHLKAIHQHYLDLLKVGCFIPPAQKLVNHEYFKLNNLEILKEMNSMIQTLLGSIRSAEKTFQEMFSDFDIELEAKRVADKRMDSSGWGMSESIEQKELEREEEFMNKMNLTKQTLQKQYNQFNLVMQSFVLHIYKNPLFSLKKLAVSLNYNGYYRVNKFADLSYISQ